MDGVGSARPSQARAVTVKCSLVVAITALLALSSCSDALMEEMDRRVSAGNQPAIAPGGSSTITAHEKITLTFPKAMDPASVSVSGDIGTVTPTWPASAGNMQMELNAANVPTWILGPGKTLTVTVSSEGRSVPYTYTYDVFNGVCVSAATGNDTDNSGTSLLPFATIQKGVDRAAALYGTAEVRVAGGSYTNNALPGYVVELKSGISLLGGYLSNGITTNWATQNPAANVTTIEDSSVGTGPTPGTPSSAVHVPSTITSPDTASIDGFTIISGFGSGVGTLVANAGIFCEGFATIRNNNIHGRSSSAQAGKWAIGITVKLSSPVIVGNTIDAGWNSSAAATESFGVYSLSSSPLIDRNTIIGGQGGIDTSGVYIAGPSTPPTIIRNNVIQGGSDSTTSYGIFNSVQATKIYNNTIDGGTGQDAYAVYIFSGNPEIKNNVLLSVTSPAFLGYDVYEAGAGSDPTALDNNDFGPAKSAYYRDEGTIDVINTGPATISTNELGSPNTLASWNNIGVDPVIAGAPSGDFRLTSGSPPEVRTGGIDGAAAVPSWGFTTDRAGVTRTGNGTTGWSMGAYEY